MVVGKRALVLVLSVGIVAIAQFAVLPLVLACAESAPPQASPAQAATVAGTAVSTTTSTTQTAAWQTLLLTPEGYSGSPADVDGDLVVWAGRAPGQPDVGNPTNTDVFLYRLSTRSMMQLTSTHNADEDFPRVSAGWVVWQGGDMGGPGRDTDSYDIYAYEVATGQVRRLTDNGASAYPEIDGDTVVWIRQRFEEPSEIWMCDLATGASRQIASCVDWSRPTIAEDIVTWHSGRSVFIYRVSSGTLTELDDRSDGESGGWSVQTDGTYVAWASNVPGALTQILLCADASTGQVEQIASGLGGYGLGAVALSAGRLAWGTPQGDALMVKMRDLASGATTVVAEVSSSDPEFSGLRFEGMRGGLLSWATNCYKVWGALHLHDLATGSTRLIAENYSGSVLGEQGIVWSDGPYGWGQVYYSGWLPPVTFSDIASSPYKVAIESLTAAGIIGGYPDGTFRPKNTLVRAHFAKIIAGALGFAVTEDLCSPFMDLGTDDPADLYPHEFVAMSWMKDITHGKTATTFEPFRPVLRAQAISMAWRGVVGVLPGVLTDPPSADVSTWGDLGPEHGWNVAGAEYNGLLSGLPLADLDPWGAMTREEAAQLLNNVRTFVAAHPAAGVSPDMTEMVTTISSEGRGREIKLPRTLPDGWRLATVSELDALGGGAYLEGEPAGSNPEMFPIFHSPGRHADSGYAVFFTQDGTQVVVVKVDELEDLPVSAGEGTGVFFEGAEWKLSRDGLGLLWAIEEPWSNIEVYSEPAGAVSIDVLLEFARTVQEISVPFYELTPDALRSIVYRYSGLADEMGVQAQRDAGEWTTALLTGTTRGFAILKWEGWGWSLAGLATDDEPASLFDRADLAVQGVPDELVDWAYEEGFGTGD